MKKVKDFFKNLKFTCINLLIKIKYIFIKFFYQIKVYRLIFKIKYNKYTGLFYTTLKYPLKGKKKKFITFIITKRYKVTTFFNKNGGYDTRKERIFEVLNKVRLKHRIKLYYRFFKKTKKDMFHYFVLILKQISSKVVVLIFILLKLYKIQILIKKFKTLKYKKSLIIKVKLIFFKILNYILFKFQKNKLILILLPYYYMIKICFFNQLQIYIMIYQIDVWKRMIKVIFSKIKQYPLSLEFYLNKFNIFTAQIYKRKIYIKNYQIRFKLTTKDLIDFFYKISIKRKYRIFERKYFKIKKKINNILYIIITEPFKIFEILLELIIKIVAYTIVFFIYLLTLPIRYRIIKKISNWLLKNLLAYNIYIITLYSICLLSPFFWSNKERKLALKNEVFDFVFRSEQDINFFNYVHPYTEFGIHMPNIYVKWMNYNFGKNGQLNYDHNYFVFRKQILFKYQLQAYEYFRQVFDKYLNKIVKHNQMEDTEFNFLLNNKYNEKNDVSKLYSNLKDDIFEYKKWTNFLINKYSSTSESDTIQIRDIKWKEYYTFEHPETLLEDISHYITGGTPTYPLAFHWDFKDLSFWGVDKLNDNKYGDPIMYRRFLLTSRASWWDLQSETYHKDRILFFENTSKIISDFDIRKSLLSGDVSDNVRYELGSQFSKLDDYESDALNIFYNAPFFEDAETVIGEEAYFGDLDAAWQEWEQFTYPYKYERYTAEFVKFDASEYFLINTTDIQGFVINEYDIIYRELGHGLYGGVKESIFGLHKWLDIYENRILPKVFPYNRMYTHNLVESDYYLGKKYFYNNFGLLCGFNKNEFLNSNYYVTKTFFNKKVEKALYLQSRVLDVFEYLNEISLQKKFEKDGDRLLDSPDYLCEEDSYIHVVAPIILQRGVLKPKQIPIPEDHIYEKSEILITNLYHSSTFSNLVDYFMINNFLSNNYQTSLENWNSYFRSNYFTYVCKDINLLKNHIFLSKYNDSTYSILRTPAIGNYYFDIESDINTITISQGDVFHNILLGRSAISVFKDYIFLLVFNNFDNYLTVPRLSLRSTMFSYNDLYNDIGVGGNWALDRFWLYYPLIKDFTRHPIWYNRYVVCNDDESLAEIMPYNDYFLHDLVDVYFTPKVLAKYNQQMAEYTSIMYAPKRFINILKTIYTENIKLEDYPKYERDQFFLSYNPDNPYQYNDLDDFEVWFASELFNMGLMDEDEAYNYHENGNFFTPEFDENYYCRGNLHGKFRWSNELTYDRELSILYMPTDEDLEEEVDNIYVIDSNISYDQLETTFEYSKFNPQILIERYLPKTVLLNNKKFNNEELDEMLLFLEEQGKMPIDLECHPEFDLIDDIQHVIDSDQDQFNNYITSILQEYYNYKDIIRNQSINGEGNHIFYETTEAYQEIAYKFDDDVKYNYVNDNQYKNNKILTFIHGNRLYDFYGYPYIKKIHSRYDKYEDFNKTNFRESGLFYYLQSRLEYQGTFQPETIMSLFYHNKEIKMRGLPYEAINETMSFMKYKAPMYREGTRGAWREILTMQSTYGSLSGKENLEFFNNKNYFFIYDNFITKAHRNGVSFLKNTNELNYQNNNTLDSWNNWYFPYHIKRLQQVFYKPTTRFCDKGEPYNPKKIEYYYPNFLGFESNINKEDIIYSFKNFEEDPWYYQKIFDLSIIVSNLFRKFNIFSSFGTQIPFYSQQDWNNEYSYIFHKPYTKLGKEYLTPSDFGKSTLKKITRQFQKGEFWNYCDIATLLDLNYSNYYSIYPFLRGSLYAEIMVTFKIFDTDLIIDQILWNWYYYPERNLLIHYWFYYSIVIFGFIFLFSTFLIKCYRDWDAIHMYRNYKGVPFRIHDYISIFYAPIVPLVLLIIIFPNLTTRIIDYIIGIYFPFGSNFNDPAHGWIYRLFTSSNRVMIDNSIEMGVYEDKFRQIHLMDDFQATKQDIFTYYIGSFLMYKVVPLFLVYITIKFYFYFLYRHERCKIIYFISDLYDPTPKSLTAILFKIDYYIWELYHVRNSFKRDHLYTNKEISEGLSTNSDGDEEFFNEFNIIEFLPVKTDKYTGLDTNHKYIFLYVLKDVYHVFKKVKRFIKGFILKNKKYILFIVKIFFVYFLIVNILQISYFILKNPYFLNNLYIELNLFTISVNDEYIECLSKITYKNLKEFYYSYLLWYFTLKLGWFLIVEDNFLYPYVYSKQYYRFGIPTEFLQTNKEYKFIVEEKYINFFDNINYPSISIVKECLWMQTLNLDLDEYTLNLDMDEYRLLLELYGKYRELTENYFEKKIFYHINIHNYIKNLIHLYFYFIDYFIQSISDYYNFYIIQLYIMFLERKDVMEVRKLIDEMLIDIKIGYDNIAFDCVTIKIIITNLSIVLYYIIKLYIQLLGLYFYEICYFILKYFITIINDWIFVYNLFLEIIFLNNIFLLIDYIMYIYELIKNDFLLIYKYIEIFIDLSKEFLIEKIIKIIYNDIQNGNFEIYDILLKGLIPILSKLVESNLYFYNIGINNYDISETDFVTFNLLVDFIEDIGHSGREYLQAYIYQIKLFIITVLKLIGYTLLMLVLIFPYKSIIYILFYSINIVIYIFIFISLYYIYIKPIKNYFFINNEKKNHFANQYLLYKFIIKGLIYLLIYKYFKKTVKNANEFIERKRFFESINSIFTQIDFLNFLYDPIKKDFDNQLQRYISKKGITSLLNVYARAYKVQLIEQELIEKYLKTNRITLGEFLEIKKIMEHDDDYCDLYTASIKVGLSDFKLLLEINDYREFINLFIKLTFKRYTIIFIIRYFYISIGNWFKKHILYRIKTSTEDSLEDNLPYINSKEKDEESKKITHTMERPDIIEKDNEKEDVKTKDPFLPKPLQDIEELTEEGDEEPSTEDDKEENFLVDDKDEKKSKLYLGHKYPWNPMYKYKILPAHFFEVDEEDIVDCHEFIYDEAIYLHKYYRSDVDKSPWIFKFFEKKKESGEKKVYTRISTLKDKKLKKIRYISWVDTGDFVPKTFDFLYITIISLIFFYIYVFFTQYYLELSEIMYLEEYLNEIQLVNMRGAMSWRNTFRTPSGNLWIDNNSPIILLSTSVDNPDYILNVETKPAVLGYMERAQTSVLTEDVDIDEKDMEDLHYEMDDINFDADVFEQISNQLKKGVLSFYNDISFDIENMPKELAMGSPTTYIPRTSAGLLGYHNSLLLNEVTSFRKNNVSVKSLSLFQRIISEFEWIFNDITRIKSKNIFNSFEHFLYEGYWSGRKPHYHNVYLYTLEENIKRFGFKKLVAYGYQTEVPGTSFFPPGDEYIDNYRLRIRDSRLLDIYNPEMISIKGYNTILFSKENEIYINYQDYFANRLRKTLFISYKYKWNNMLYYQEFFNDFILKYKTISNNTEKKDNWRNNYYMIFSGFYDFCVFLIYKEDAFLKDFVYKIDKIFKHELDLKTLEEYYKYLEILSLDKSIFATFIRSLFYLIHPGPLGRINCDGDQIKYFSTNDFELQSYSYSKYYKNIGLVPEDFDFNCIINYYLNNAYCNQFITVFQEKVNARIREVTHYPNIGITLTHIYRGIGYISPDVYLELNGLKKFYFDYHKHILDGFFSNIFYDLNIYYSDYMWYIRWNDYFKTRIYQHNGDIFLNPLHLGDLITDENKYEMIKQEYTIFNYYVQDDFFTKLSKYYNEIEDKEDENIRILNYSNYILE
jgi:hypothetical protein